MPSSPTKKKPKRIPKSKIKADDLELDPDAWPKFEQLIRDAAKLGPKPRDKQSKR
jgi:hypothetical protein